YMTCGQLSPPLPIAIQCVSLDEARHVPKALQGIVNSLPPNPDSTQLLTAFGDSPSIQTLLGDHDGLYVVVIGVPPGVHRTRSVVVIRIFFQVKQKQYNSESVSRAEGTFRYPICGYTMSFWEALAFDRIPIPCPTPYTWYTLTTTPWPHPSLKKHPFKCPSAHPIPMGHPIPQPT
ncbi:hypothetical protein PAXRUDRAFT_159355, partial [Paxillus rubicundulus Ve08.2h10]